MRAFHRPIRGLAAYFGVLAFSLFAMPGITPVSAQTASTTATNNPEADKAWKETYRATRAPMPPREWETNAPTAQQELEFWQGALAKAADKAKDFYTKYPTHPKAADARQIEYNLLTMAAEKFGDTNQLTRLDTLTTEHLKDSSITDDERLRLRLGMVGRLAKNNLPANP